MAARHAAGTEVRSRSDHVDAIGDVLAMAERVQANIAAVIDGKPEVIRTAVAVLLAEIGDVGPGRFEDAQAEEPEHGDQREVAWAR